MSNKYSRPVNAADYAKYGTSPNERPDFSQISLRAAEKRLKQARHERVGRTEPFKARYPRSRRVALFTGFSKYMPHQGNQECARRANPDSAAYKSYHGG